MAFFDFLAFYRSLARHRLHAVLSIGGLALGIAVFLVLYLYVQFERGYDRHLPTSDDVYLVTETYNLPGLPETPGFSTMGGLIDLLKADFAGLEGVRMRQSAVTILQGDRSTAEDISLVDSDYFDLFPWPKVSGDPAASLDDPDTVIMTREMAEKHFGDVSAIGSQTTIEINGEARSFRLGAVIENLPANVTYRNGIFALYVRDRYQTQWFDNWGSSEVQTFLRLPDRAAAAELESQLPVFIDRHASSDGDGRTFSSIYRLDIEPLIDIRLIEESERNVIVTLGIVGVLTLLIAIVNFVNLATARAGLRAREVAMRKVLGGTRSSLVVQFLAEAIATVAISALIGLALAELSLPFINSVGGTSLEMEYLGANSILFLLVPLVLIIGVLAGLYPAFVLSGFRPAPVLASARAPGGGKAGQRLRRFLVLTQFAIAIAFTISTITLVQQTQHLSSTDLGFEREGLISIPSLANFYPGDNGQQEMLAALSRVEGVTSVALGNDSPGVIFTSSAMNLQRSGENQPEPSVTWVRTGPDYFDTYNARLVTGRLFTANQLLDDFSNREPEGDTVPVFNVIINRTAAQDLGFDSAENAIGEIVLNGNIEYRVVGVIEDIRFRSPREAVRPTLYFYQSRGISDAIAVVRFAGRAARDVRGDLEAVWKQTAPTVPFSAETVNQQLYDEFYEADAQRTRLFTIGAVLAVLIGCIGLYGLASFDTARRVKEIGIRKTLGASTIDILKLLIGQFLRPVLLANLIAWPLAFFAMREWLSGFDDRVALSPTFFLAGSLLAIIVAALTVFGQAFRVARAEPAKALRYE